MYVCMCTYKSVYTHIEILTKIKFEICVYFHIFSIETKMLLFITLVQNKYMETYCTNNSIVK